MVQQEIEDVASPAPEAVEEIGALDEPSGTEGRIGARVRRARRRRVKRATIKVHRWTSLVLGLVLLVITTSGALVVYTPEWLKWTNPDVFTVTSSPSPISFGQALAVVNRAHPDFQAGGVNVYQGLYEVTSTDDEEHPGFYGVDPGSGRITGYTDPEHGVMAFLNQVHECFFTCDTYPGYLSFLNASVPTLGMGWLSDMTYGGVTLGVAALLLMFLALSGIWLWWPTLKRFAHGFRVRWSKGRYARDYDLHNVIGITALPFLLIWALTGANFEFSWVSTAWYATTGGQAPDETSFTSTEVKNGKDIGFDAAVAAATAKAGPDRPLVSAYSPTPDDATATYSFWFADGFDTWKHGGYPGDYGIDVDRYDATRTHIGNYSTSPRLSNQLLDNLGAPTFHYGQSVDGWWRIGWFLFGLTPLALAVTGMSTWLAKRGVCKRRKRAQAARAA